MRPPLTRTSEELSLLCMSALMMLPHSLRVINVRQEYTYMVV